MGEIAEKELEGGNIVYIASGTPHYLFSIINRSIHQPIFIDRTTLYHIEKGKSSVSMAAYFNTHRVLGIQDDFLLEKPLL